MLECVTPQDAAPYLQRMTERRMADLAILGFMGVKLPWLDQPQVKKELPMRQEDVVIGGYCKGKCVAECKALFGVALWQVCRVCPN